MKHFMMYILIEVFGETRIFCVTLKLDDTFCVISLSFIFISSASNKKRTETLRHNNKILVSF